MSLEIQMNSFDYSHAVKKVQALLDDIETYQKDESSPIKLVNVPTAAMIVDLVWDCIN